MNCVTSAVVAAALIGGSFMTLTVTKEQHEKLKRSLSPDLATLHDGIARERRNQYIHGLILGLILAYILLGFVAGRGSRFHRMAAFVAVTMLVGVFYYLLMPKSTYMLEHLKTKEQNLAWLEVYKTMKMRYTVGLLLGAAAAAAAANSIC
jgi:hypothetical protein